MEILKIAQVLKENELLIGEVYGECKKFFPEHAEFFTLLESEEQGHAYLIEQMISDMTLRPEAWQIGNISLTTANNVNELIKRALTEIRLGNASPKYAVTFAISVELSLSEKNFGSLFITDSNVFKDSQQKLEDGFKSHYDKLLEVKDKIFAEN